MESIISEFYYGNIQPNVRHMPSDSQLGKAASVFAEAEEELTGTLTGQDKKTLLRLLNAHAEIVGALEHDSFCRGFRLGALMILDIMASTDKLFKEK